MHQEAAQTYLQLLQQRKLLCIVPSSTCRNRCCCCCCSSALRSVGLPQQLQPFAALRQQLMLCLQPRLLAFEFLSQQQLGGELRERSQCYITLL
jgi:hypothetical protein